MATTANDFKRIRTRYPGKLDDGVDQYVGDVWPPAYTAQTKSVDLDGSTEYFAKTTNDALFNNAEFTMMIWAKKEEVWIGGGQLIMLHGPGYSNTMNMEISASHETRMDVSQYDSSASSRHWVRYDSTWSLGDWRQIIWAHDGPNDDSRFYVNGTEQKNDTDALAFTSVDHQIYRIGNALPGRVHSVAYWDTQLDADAVTVIYNSFDSDIDLNVDSGNYDNSGNLICWWRPGHSAGADTELGYNYSAVTADKDSYNIMDNAANVTTADVVTDAP